MTTPYLPINCEFHDVLEAAATRGRAVAITFVDGAGHAASVQARITDVFARNGAEYLRLDDATLIRLDAIERVDGVLRSAFETTYVVPKPA